MQIRVNNSVGKGLPLLLHNSVGKGSYYAPISYIRGCTTVIAMMRILTFTLSSEMII